MFTDISILILLVAIFFVATLFLIARCLTHFVLVLILLDLLLLCNIILFALAAVFSANMLGYVAAVLVLGVAAADTAVGLGVFIVYFKVLREVSIKNNLITMCFHQDLL